MAQTNDAGARKLPRVPLQRLREKAAQERRAYHPDQGEAAHLATMAAYGCLVAGAVVTARVRGAALPTLSPWDTARMALATYKGARLLTKEKVTAPLRAPFTQRDGNGEGSEVADVPRGEGARRTVGELLSCPFCLGQWVVTGLAVGMIFAPAGTRIVASTLAAAAGADFLHYAYATAQQLPGAVGAESQG